MESVFQYLPAGPVYLSNYRRELTEVGEDGFRLRPSGPFYQVVEPGDTSVPPDLAAARVYARKKKLGPYARPMKPHEDADKIYKRHLGSLARAGFSYDVARQVLSESV